MKLSTEQVAAAAEALYRAERERRQIPALSQRFSMDMDDAYAVQRAWVDRRIADGEAVIGYKIGLTSRAMQLAMNIDTPDFGVLTDAMLINSGATVPAAAYLDPRIETEFAFFLKEPLGGEQVTPKQVMAATDYLVPALELIAARSRRVDPDTGYTRTVFDTIADNAANAGVICGSGRVAPEAIDLAWAGAILRRNGEVEDTGLGAAVMGHPAHGICWLCRRLAPHGIRLEPGQLLLSGSFTRPVAVTDGDIIEADYGALGHVTISFS